MTSPAGYPSSAAATAVLDRLPAPAPLSGWRRLASDSLLVGGTTLVCQALGAVTSLALRLLLEPAQMGVWQGLRVFLGYANYANLGASKAAARELSLAQGRGNLAAVAQALNLAHTANLLGSLVFAAGMAAAAGWQAWRTGGWDNSPWALGLLVVAALAVLQRSVTFQVTLLRSRQEFRTASQLALQEAVLTLVVAGGAAWLAGLAGLYAGTGLVMLASLWFVRRHAHGIELRWAWQPREMGRLMAVGAPMVAAGLATTLFLSLDKLMILAGMREGERQLGCYSAALLVTGQLFGLGNMLSVTVAPRLAELFGRTESRAGAARLAARVSEIQAAVLALPAGLALVWGPPVLARLLPEYQSGLDALVWLVPGTVAAAMALPASQYLLAVEGGKKLLAVLLVGIAVAAGGIALALASGGGLAGVAAATAAANLLVFAMLLAVSFWKELSAAERARYMAAAALLIGPALGVGLVARCWAQDAADPLSADLLGGAAVIVAWTASAMLGWHWGGWGKVFRQGRSRVGIDQGN